MEVTAKDRKEVIALVTIKTANRVDINRAEIINSGLKAVIARATIKTGRAINRVRRADISRVRRGDIVLKEATSNAEAITTTAVDTITVAVTIIIAETITTMVATITTAAIIKGATVNARQITIRMRNIASKSALNIRKNTSIPMNRYV